MSSGQNFQVRRATLDDVQGLSQLWKLMGYPVENLAKRITDFQVVEDDRRQLLGALALQMTNRQGLIHSESFGDFALADHLRPLLWARIQSLSANHGLFRLWTQEQAPFWHHSGLKRADADELAIKPEAWDSAGDWLTIKLREDIEQMLSADSTLALFMEQQKAESRKMAQHAKVAKTIATLIAVLLFLGVLAGAFLVLFKRKGR